MPAPDGRDTLVMAFADPAIADHPDQPLQQLAETWKGKAILGCSTAGQISADSLTDDSIVVVIAQFDQTQLPTAAVEVDVAGGARRCGRQIGAALSNPKLRGVLVLSDGLAVNGTALATGISEALPGVPISGGLAGDGDRFGTTWVLADGVPRSGWVTAVGFVGDHVELEFGSAGGWDIFGPERLVTRSYHSTLYELDDRPALSLYREYLGDQADGLPASALRFPLSLSDLDGRTTVRTVLATDEETQSLRFAGDVAQGSLAQLMCASSERLVDGAHRAAVMASTGREQLAIAVSCIGRRLVLGQRTEEEIEAVIEGLNPGAVLAGFYSYGELSPTVGTCDLHNQTMTITTIAERPA
jgi:hypothetical protein